MSGNILTVIIPIYNREKFINEAIENVLSQGCENLDLIVVDDGSTDGSAARARTYPEVRVLSQINSGPAAARNLGIAHARGDCIAFLDSDDLWAGGMLVRLLDELEKYPQIDVSMGLMQVTRIINASGEYEILGDPRTAFPYSICGTVFRRRVFSQVGLFDAELRYGEDTDWFHRAQVYGIGVSRLGVVSVLVRRHGENMTKGKNMLELNVLRVFKKALDRKRSTPLV